MAKINQSKYALLGLLSLTPMSGYDIKKIVNESLRFFWNENYGRIYPMLKQMEEDGTVVSHKEKQGNSPERTVYTVTDQGKNELREWLGANIARTPLRDELVLRVFFGFMVPPELNIAQMKDEIENCDREITELEEIEIKLPQDYPEQPGLPFWLMTLDYGKEYFRLRKKWSEKVIDYIKEQKL